MLNLTCFAIATRPFGRFETAMTRSTKLENGKVALEQEVQDGNAL
jgi:hypothetical protein